MSTIIFLTFFLPVFVLLSCQQIVAITRQQRTACNQRLRGSASNVATCQRRPAKSMGDGDIWPPTESKPLSRAECNKIRHNWLRPREDPLNQMRYKSIHGGGLLRKWVNYNVLCLFIYWLSTASAGIRRIHSDAELFIFFVAAKQIT